MRGPLVYNLLNAAFISSTQRLLAGSGSLISQLIFQGQMAAIPLDQIIEPQIALFDNRIFTFTRSVENEILDMHPIKTVAVFLRDIDRITATVDHPGRVQTEANIHRRLREDPIQGIGRTQMVSTPVVVDRDIDIKFFAQRLQ